ncbi:hypothetical protein H1R20_g14321, partial [Candolleomyces eurysporus]
MTLTTPPEVGVDDFPLPTVVEKIRYFDTLACDRPDTNDTDDEYTGTWVDDRSYSNEDVDSTDEEEDRANVASALLENPVEKACTTANKAFCATQDSGTPLKHSTHRVKEFKSSDDIKEHLLEELGPMDTIPRADIVQWISPAYEHLAREDHIHEFLNRVPLKHHAVHTSSPDICVEASGPSFTLKLREIIGFSNIATFVDGKLEKDAFNLQAHMLQMGGYARQMFIQQPNRMFVRCLIITQHRARLFHFDRSGVQYTPLFDYHARPRLFIRLVLGLCSTEESTIGLDKSFQWITGPQGVRLGGILETVRNDKTKIKYNLDMEEDIFNRTSISGRGTVCWPVKDSKTGERFLIKDYWMSEGRTPEYELLEKVRYTPGLCHMISHEEGGVETKDFRGDPSAFTCGNFHNRKSIRITIKFYGTSIDNFKSPQEMLAALRDAIQAHQALYSKGILHRDITHNNVLIGAQGFESEDGERGVIIDLDMAIENLCPILDICKDFRTIWDFEDEDQSHARKLLFISSPSTLADAEYAIDPDWHSACFKLFLNFYEFVHQVFQAKDSAIYRRKEPILDGTVANRYTDLLDNVNGNYKYIIALFDAALMEIKEDAVKEASLKSLNDAPSSPMVEALPAVSTVTSRKPRTRSLRRGSPLVELSLTERTPKRWLAGSGSE